MKKLILPLVLTIGSSIHPGQLQKFPKIVNKKLNIIKHQIKSQPSKLYFNSTLSIFGIAGSADGF